MLIYLEADFDLGENDCIEVLYDIPENKYFDYIVIWIKHIFSIDNLKLNIDEDTIFEEGMTVKIITVAQPCVECKCWVSALENKSHECAGLHFQDADKRLKIEMLRFILRNYDTFLFEKLIGEENLNTIKKEGPDSYLDNLETTIVEYAPEEYIMEVLKESNHRDMKNIFDKVSIGKISYYIEAGYKTTSMDIFPYWWTDWKNKILVYVNNYSKSTFEETIYYIFSNSYQLFKYFLELELYETFGRTKEDSIALMTEIVINNPEKWIREYFYYLNINENSDPRLLYLFSHTATLFEIEKYIDDGNSIDKLTFGGAIYELSIDRIKELIAKNIRMPDIANPILYPGDLEFLLYFTSIGYKFDDSVIDAYIYSKNYVCITYLLRQGLKLKEHHLKNALLGINVKMVDFLLRNNCPRGNRYLNHMVSGRQCTSDYSQCSDGSFNGQAYYIPETKCYTPFCCYEEGERYRKSEKDIFYMLKQDIFRHERNKPYFVNTIHQIGGNLERFAVNSRHLFPSIFK